MAWERTNFRWERSPGRVKAVKVIERGRLLRELRSFEYRKDIVELLSMAIEESDSEQMRRRKEELRRVVRVQREMRRELGGAVECGEVEEQVSRRAGAPPSVPLPKVEKPPLALVCRIRETSLDIS